jgi:hypothetical protein
LLVSAMPELSDDQTMLCLAGLAYRGFQESGWGAEHDSAVARAVLLGLETLAPLRDRWELVWGPATYRASFSVIDDTMAYVVRDVRRPHRCVIVVRGTNPGSAFDWAFGDLWAGHQVPWPSGDGGARVSLSTALGLTLLRQLRSPARTPDASAVDDGPPPSLLDLVGRPGLHHVRHAFVALVTNLLATQDELAHDVRATPLGELAARWQSRAHTLMSTVVGETAQLMSGRADLALLSLLETQASLRARLGAGTSIEQLLADLGPSEVVVTGHSKGGALASTLALWLHETRDAWAPEGGADVHCWSFAGPTAGNAAFVTRSNAAIGPRCRRIVNSLDVVPHAWAIGDLEAVDRLYDPTRVVPLPALGTLVGIMAAATAHLDYRHVGTRVTTLTGTLSPNAVAFVAQLIHQHMQAYCELLGLTEHGVTVRSFFEPQWLLPNGTAA